MDSAAAAAAARRQRGPTTAHHTGKQKKKLLQDARRRHREHVAEQDAYDAALAASASHLPKVVQARLYTRQAGRGGSFFVRLKLSIDRQLCAGFIPGRSPPGVAADQTPATGAGPRSLQTPETEAQDGEQRSARQLATRVAALQARLTALAKLKSLREVEREWLDGMNTCTQLVRTASGLEQPTAARPFMFGVVQQALQTGPSLNYGKPAQFKRMAKALSKGEGVAADHPHAKAVRRLLETFAPGAPAGEGVLSTKQHEVVRDWRQDFDLHFQTRHGRRGNHAEQPALPTEADAAQPVEGSGQLSEHAAASSERDCVQCSSSQGERG